VNTPLLSEDDITRLVKAFYADIRDDVILGPIFKSRIADKDWERHEAHISNFWSSVFLKSKRFDGNPMAKHAALAGLTPAMFDHWLNLFRAASNRTLAQPKAEAINTMAEKIAQSLQMGLAFSYEKQSMTENPFQAFGVRRSHSTLNDEPL